MSMKTIAEFKIAIDAEGDRRTATFIRENFSAKACTSFVPLSVSRQRRAVQFCHCGATAAEHGPNQPLEGEWSEQECIKKSPTNAFGKIHFRSSDVTSTESTKYVRLSDDSDTVLATELMTKFWRLIEDDDGIDTPQLIISIVGGGRLFNLADNVKKKLFSRDLMRAVETTSGWLFTSGLDVGVVSCVGDSMRESQSIVWRAGAGNAKTRISCIGIAPWGCVYSNAKLINRDVERLNEVTYPVYTNAPRSRSSKCLPLNPHHTHFLLVDDGHRNRERGAADFRARLENQISLSVENGGLGVPVVEILIDGAAEALEAVEKSVTYGIPVLICEGTGRAADLLPVVCRQYDNICKSGNETEKTSKLNSFRYFLRERVMTELYNNYRVDEVEDRCDRCVHSILQICEKRNMVHIFNVKRGPGLDTAILSCLMECKHLERANQLWLALSWNRVDVAQAKILNHLTSSANEPALDLWPIFVQALIDDKPEFIQLFVQFGLEVKSSLTVRALREIYNKTAHRQTLLRRLIVKEAGKLKRSSILLVDIYNLIKGFVRRFVQSQYSNDNGDNEEACASDETFANPFNELFLWSILLNRDALAVRLWEQCEEPLIMAVIGTILSESLAHSGKTLTGAIKEQQLALKSKLEQMAINLAKKAFSANVEGTMQLLHVGWSTWGGLNCMALAALAQDREFLSSEPCQFAIWKTWNRGYEATAWQILLCAFLIGPTIFLIKFDEDISPEDEVPPPGKLNKKRGSIVSVYKPKQEKTFRVGARKLTSCYPLRRRDTLDSLPPDALDGPSGQRADGRTVGKGLLSGFGEEYSPFLMSPFSTGYRWGSKLITFFTSPSVKFAWHTFSYLVYLMLYGYVILFAFRFRPTGSEIMLYIWTFTLICEQIRIILSYPSVEFYGKLEEWWILSSIAAWNRIDFFTLFVSLISFVLRWSSRTFFAARLLLTVNFIPCLFRLFKIYFVNSYLGPKVVMLKRMAFDLVMFLLVLVIILLSYTVVSHALLEPYTQYSTGIYWDLIFHGIWVLFGEVQSELDRANELNRGICANASAEDYPGHLDCEVPTFPATILLAVYCFFGNILLVNMLIATFTYVFEDVQAHSEHLWKFLMYFVVDEYNSKPFLPPPLIIFQHIYFLILHFRKERQKAAAEEIVWGKPITALDYKFLMVFERTLRADLVEQNKIDDDKQVQRLIPEVYEKVNRLLNLLTSLKAEVKEQTHFKRAQARAYVPAMKMRGAISIPLIDATAENQTEPEGAQYLDLDDSIDFGELDRGEPDTDDFIENFA